MALQASLDATDTAARSISTTVVMHRASWLQLSRFLRKVQNTGEDLPFDCHKLFLETPNDSLLMLKDSRAILCSLGMYTSISKKHFRRSQTAQRSSPAQFSEYQRPAEPSRKRDRFQRRRATHLPSGTSRHNLNNSSDDWSRVQVLLLLLFYS